MRMYRGDRFSKLEELDLSHANHIGMGGARALGLVTKLAKCLITIKTNRCGPVRVLGV